MYNNFIVETSTKAGLLFNKVSAENGPFLNFFFTRHAKLNRKMLFLLVLAFDIAQKAIKKIKAFTRE